MKIRINQLLTKGKCLLLAYDQGLEHGPSDFNDKNINPEYVLDIAEKGGYNGVIFQKGIAEKYYSNNYKVPLIVKLNGKTNILKGDPYSPQLCSVKEAVKLNAVAVGYTIYVGSVHEAKMFSEFEMIQKQAHEYALPVIAWMYPRGENVKNEFGKEVLAYAARIGLELGADFIKMKYNGNINDFKWIIKSAGKVKVLIAGGPKKNEKEILKEAYDVINNGAVGLAIGRNVWQHQYPLKITKALKKIIFDGKNIRDVLKIINKAEF
jgi:class I fructose-bisphosphate aldolase